MTLRTTRCRFIGRSPDLRLLRHVEHIYAKIGVSNRARASLFAMKHGLVVAE